MLCPNGGSAPPNPVRVCYGCTAVLSTPPQQYGWWAQHSRATSAPGCDTGPAAVCAALKFPSSPTPRSSWTKLCPVHSHKPFRPGKRHLSAVQRRTVAKTAVVPVLAFWGLGPSFLQVHPPKDSHAEPVQTIGCHHVYPTESAGISFLRL